MRAFTNKLVEMVEAGEIDPLELFHMMMAYFSETDIQGLMEHFDLYREEDESNHNLFEDEDEERNVEDIAEQFGFGIHYEE